MAPPERAWQSHPDAGGAPVPDTLPKHAEKATEMPLESNSAASVSPALVFELENGSTFTFNFQMDGRVAVIGFQEGRAVTGTLSEEQAAELRDAIGEYIHKRNG